MPGWVIVGQELHNRDQLSYYFIDKMWARSKEINLEIQLRINY